MSDDMKRRTHWDRSSEVEWDELSSGETLVKFIAVDKGMTDGDCTVTIHGFRDSRGVFYITNEKVDPPEESS